MSDPHVTERRLERERLARKEAERLLEQKSRELFEVNLKLQEHARHLEAEVAERQRAEAHFRNITESLAEGLLLTDFDDVVLYANHRMKELTGYTPDELVGRRAYEVFLDSEEWPEMRLRNERRQQGQCENYELTLRHKDGHTFWVHVNAAPYFDTAGNCAATIGAITDITARKRAEQELKELNAQLVEASRQAGMAEVATGVLHNVGNVLNGVNLSTTLIREKLEQSRLAHLTKAVDLLREKEAGLAAFLTADPRGRQLPQFLGRLTEHLVEEKRTLLEETDALDKNVQHIKQIVAMQQSFACVFGVTESLQAERLMEDAVQFNAPAFERHGIKLARQYEPAPRVLVDRHKVLQILINLLRNAKHAVRDGGGRDKQINLTIAATDQGRVKLAITDNGIGITQQDLTKIFRHGFTTKKDGHGFGLHSGALAAKEMNGSLSVHSDGPGTGATFTLELPIAVSQLAA